jgi:hypothetical protein
MLLKNTPLDVTDVAVKYEAGWGDLVLLHARFKELVCTERIVVCFPFRAPTVVSKL